MFGGSDTNKDVVDKPKDENESAWLRFDAADERLKHWLNYTASEVQGFLNETTLGGLASLTSLKPLSNSFGGLLSAPHEAYPVPSVKQYAECVEQNGRSVWTEDGVWRCLFKGAAAPEKAGREFTDFTGFLEHQRGLLRAREAEIDARLQSRLQAQAQALAPPASANANESAPAFPGNNRPRLISEEEARGKRVVSQNEASEVVTLGDGRRATRTQVIKHFDDGTALMKRTTSEDDTGSKGWFWN